VVPLSRGEATSKRTPASARRRASRTSNGAPVRMPQWDESVIENPGGQGVSAGLIESLEDIVAPHLRSLNLSFEWAAAAPRQDVGLATIVFVAT
jgi:hypothetical protein